MVFAKQQYQMRFSPHFPECLADLPIADLRIKKATKYTAVSAFGENTAGLAKISLINSLTEVPLKFESISLFETAVSGPYK